MRAKTADATIEAAGSSIVPFGFSGIQADVDLEGQNLRSIQRLIRSDGLPKGPFQIAFHLTWDAAGYRIRNIKGSLNAHAMPGPIVVDTGEASVSEDNELTALLEGSWRKTRATVKVELAGEGPQQRLGVKATLGDTVLSGDLELALGGPRPRITGKLNFAEVDLRGLPQEWPESEKPIPGQGPRKAWSERALPSAALNAFDADLTVEAGLVVSEQMQAEGVQGRVSIKDGRLRLEDVSASLPGMRLTGRATLDTRTQPPTFEVAMDTGRVKLPQALWFLSSPPEVEGSLHKVSLRAKARGNTSAALINTLGGALKARTAVLWAHGKRPGKGTGIRLAKPKITITPGKTVGLHTDVMVEQQEVILDLTGGPLENLITEDQPWPTIRVVARGKLQDEAVEVQGNIGPLSALLAGRDLGVDLSAHRGGVKASIKGTLARFDGLRDSMLTVKASGASLSFLNPLLGVELPEDQNFEVSARLDGRDQGLDIRDLKAISGTSDMAGDLHIHLEPGTRVEATLASRHIDLTPYLAARNGGATDVKASLSEVLPLEILHALDGALHLQAGHVQIGDFGADDGNLDATLDAGHFRLSVNAGQERLVADVELKPEKTQWRLNLKHKGKLNLSWLVEEENNRALSRLPAVLDVRLSGTGNSLQTLLESADGHVDLVLGAGRLNKKLAALPLTDIIVTLLDAVNPASLQQPFANINCAVFDLDVADGIATSNRGLAVQTEAFNVIGGGALNLGSNEIDIHFKTAKRKGLGINVLGITDRFIYITGTLGDPKVAVDLKGLLFQGGAAWATSGLSVLYDQLAKRLTAFSNPCEAVMKKGEQ